MRNVTWPQVALVIGVLAVSGITGGFAGLVTVATISAIVIFYCGDSK